MKHAAEGLVAKKEYRRLLDFKSQVDTSDEYIGSAIPLLRVFEKIGVFNQNNKDPVLILGPTGSGKSAIARLVHAHSKREGKLYTDQAANFMSSDEGIYRVRWVGTGKDALLSGAKSGKAQEGVLKIHDGGTVLIDELHELPLHAQTFLLDVLDGKAIPLVAGVGENAKGNVRLLFASNFSEAALERRLKPDFFRRINTRVLQIPSLAERKEDIPLLARSFCSKQDLSAKFLLTLLLHDWPGNVGELKDAISYASDFAAWKREKLQPHHLPDAFDNVRSSIEGMSDDRAQEKLVKFLADFISCQSGKVGLQSRISEIWGCSEATVSRVIARMHAPWKRRIELGCVRILRRLTGCDGLKISVQRNSSSKAYTILDIGGSVILLQ